SVVDQDEGDHGHWQHLGAEIVGRSAAEEQPEPSIPEGLGKVEHVVISGCGELPQAAGWQSMSEPRVPGSSLIPETDHPASASKPVNSPRVRSWPPTRSAALSAQLRSSARATSAERSNSTPCAPRTAFHTASNWWSKPPRTTSRRSRPDQSCSRTRVPNALGDRLGHVSRKG